MAHIPRTSVTSRGQGNGGRGEADAIFSQQNEFSEFSEWGEWARGVAQPPVGRVWVVRPSHNHQLPSYNLPQQHIWLSLFPPQDSPNPQSFSISHFQCHMTLWKRIVRPSHNNMSHSLEQDIWLFQATWLNLLSFNINWGINWAIRLRLQSTDVSN